MPGRHQDSKVGYKEEHHTDGRILSRVKWPPCLWDTHSRIEGNPGSQGTCSNIFRSSFPKSSEAETNKSAEIWKPDYASRESADLMLSSICNLWDYLHSFSGEFDWLA